MKHIIQNLWKFIIQIKNNMGIYLPQRNEEFVEYIFKTWIFPCLFLSLPFQSKWWMLTQTVVVALIPEEFLDAAVGK